MTAWARLTCPESVEGPRGSLHQFTLYERIFADGCDHRVKGDVQAEKDEGTLNEHNANVNPACRVAGAFG
jgi:hypothetical protein